MLTYALTDIHGRFDLLQKAMEYIVKDSGTEEYRVVLCGDYVDRGPQSKEVVSLIKNLTTLDPDKYIALLGNHEDIFINYLRKSRRYPDGIFEGNGGLETLESYIPDGLKPSDALKKAYNKYLTTYARYHEKGGTEPDNEVAIAYYSHIVKYADYVAMREHASWMHKLPRYFIDGTRLFVHAGIDPSYSLEDQLSDDLIWTRSKTFFYAYREQMKYYVVHGHTCYHDGKKWDEPENTDARCNLDTGACHGGVLSLGVFNDKQERPVEIVAITLDM